MGVTKSASSVNAAKSALAALTQAAIALPGLAQAADVYTDYLYSNYTEQDIPGSRTASGRDSARYDIQSHLLRVLAPVGEQTLGMNLTYETMSGASPWYVVPDAQSRPVQVMSGASIREERTDVQGTWSLPVPGGSTALSLGYSSEDDYEALNAGIELEIDNETDTLTWTGGAGYSDDTLQPTRGRSSPNVIDGADKSTVTLYTGVSGVLDAQTVLQGAVSFQYQEGFLSDPYKLAWIQSLANTVPDRRPDERQSLALSARLRHYVGGPGAALHLDYRYYTDDWEIEAHTVELAWHQVLGDNWRISPSVRWYSQGAAAFYAPYYEQPRGDGMASSDYRLSPFGALSARLDLGKSIGNWSLGGGVEYYEASADYAAKSVDFENPGLVEYLSLQARLAFRF